MFAHPATHHFDRTYTGHNPSAYPTTSKKNINKENAGALPSKTPSRGALNKNGGLVPSTSVRMGLGMKSMVKDGNVQRTFDQKGKGKDEEIEPKRLFASTSSKPGIQPSKSFSSFPTINPTRTLHRTPGPSKSLSLRTPAPAPPTPLPSASRTRRRSRQSLTPIKSSVIEFKTPAPSGKWDEEISLGSIEGLNELDEVVEVYEGEEGDDEVEYMPPPLPEIPFEPWYELPDLNHAFGVLSKMPPVWVMHQDPVEPTFDIDIGEDVVDMHLCDDDMLEEPMFRKPAAVSTPIQTAEQAPKKNAISRAPLPRSALASKTPGPGRVPTKQPIPSTASRITTSSRSTINEHGALRPAATKPAPRTVFTSKPTSRPPTTPAMAKPPPAATRPLALRPGVMAAKTTTQPASSTATNLRPIIKIEVPTLDLAQDMPLDEEPEFSLDLE